MERKFFVTRGLIKSTGNYSKILTPREKWISAKAAALLRKVRKQRDAEAKRAEHAERCYSFFYVGSLLAKIDEADAARIAALEVAEREHARAERAEAQAGELRALVEAFIYADSVSYDYGKMQQVKEKARRLLAAHKEQRA